MTFQQQALETSIEVRLEDFFNGISADAAYFNIDERTTTLQLKGFAPDLAVRYTEYLHPGAPRPYDNDT